MQWHLRFPKNDVGLWAGRYVENNARPGTEDRIIQSIQPDAKTRGNYTQEEFLTVCKWKSQRPERYFDLNSEEEVREITGLALSTSSERTRIRVLTALDGVGWPVASVLLHFGHRDRYPILDVRALSSLSVDPPNQYTFDFWMEYVRYCRSLADELNVDMRTLDRALWQYSKEND